jgi:hypothetical protein
LVPKPKELRGVKFSTSQNPPQLSSILDFDNKQTRPKLEQHLVKNNDDLTLSQSASHVVPCNKELLCDSAMIIHVPELVKELDSFVLEPNTCVKHKIFLPIATKNDQIKLLSSVTTLSYIEFDNMCDLSNLEEKFVCAELP